MATSDVKEAAERFDTELQALREINAMLDSWAPTHHAIVAGAERPKPMMPQERVRWLLGKWQEHLAHDRIYPCDGCGKMRTKAEGGTVFTVCDSCWENRHRKQPHPPALAARPADEAGIDEGVVESLGFEMHFQPDPTELHFRQDVWSISIREIEISWSKPCGVTMRIGDTEVVLPITTRGALANLCAALGIDLKGAGA